MGKRQDLTPLRALRACGHSCGAPSEESRLL